MSEFADRIIGPPNNYGLDRDAHRDAYEELARIHAELNEWIIRVAEELVRSPSPGAALVAMTSTLDNVCLILGLSPNASEAAERLSILRTEARRRARAAESMELHSS